MMYSNLRWKKVGLSQSEADFENMKCIRATKDFVESTGSDVAKYGSIWKDGWKKRLKD